MRAWFLQIPAEEGQQVLNVTARSDCVSDQKLTAADRSFESIWMEIEFYKQPNTFF